MSVDYMKLFAPLVASVLFLGAVIQIPAELLGIALKYAGGAIAIGVIVLYVIFVGKPLAICGLTNIGSLAWGDIFERHLYTDEKIIEDDIPHWTRIWIAYASSLLREWLKGNFKLVSFKAYYNDMVVPLLEDDKDATINTHSKD